MRFEVTALASGTMLPTSLSAIWVVFLQHAVFFLLFVLKEMVQEIAQQLRPKQIEKKKTEPSLRPSGVLLAVSHHQWRKKNHSMCGWWCSGASPSSWAE